MTFSNGWYEIRPSGTDVKIKSYPSTKEARISAVIANAIGEVYPRVFFEMVEGKPIEGMENTANYILNMQTKDS